MVCHRKSTHAYDQNIQINFNMLNHNKCMASTHSEEAYSAYSELCQTFKCFAKIVNVLFTIFAKRSILDVWQVLNTPLQ